MLCICTIPAYHRRLEIEYPEVTVPMAGVRLSFWARSGSAGVPLKVGTVSALDEPVCSPNLHLIHLQLRLSSMFCLSPLIRN